MKKAIALIVMVCFGIMCANCSFEPTQKKPNAKTMANEEAREFVKKMLAETKTTANIHSGNTSFMMNGECRPFNNDGTNNNFCDYRLYITPVFVIHADGKEEKIFVGKYIYEGDGSTRTAIMDVPKNDAVAQTTSK